MTTFSELGLSKGYIKSLKELNIINPTEIQEEVITEEEETETFMDAESYQDQCSE